MIDKIIVLTRYRTGTKHPFIVNKITGLEPETYPNNCTKVYFVNEDGETDWNLVREDWRTIAEMAGIPIIEASQNND